METEDLVLEAFQDMKICGDFTASTLAELLNDWAGYSKILATISSELKVLARLDEAITPLESSEEDPTSLFMEISCLLTELGCPYQILTEGQLNVRFDTNEKRLLLLNFLLSELQACQMHLANNPNFTQSQHMKIKLEESEQAKLLREILQTLDFSKPPEGVDISTLCKKVQDRVGSIQRRLKISQVETKPLFVGVLNPNHWHQLGVFNKELFSEYKVRREMLLKRLDVTIQSFQWSSGKTDKTQERNRIVEEIFREKRSKLDPMPSVSLSKILAARGDLVYFEKTSSGSLREHTRSEVNKVRIGNVPDRGGRPNEAEPPPPEMPSWKQRSTGGGQSGSVGWKPRGGGRGGGRGGQQDSRGGSNFSHQFRGGNRGGYREGQGGGRYDLYADGGQVGYRQDQGDGYSQGVQQYYGDNYSQQVSLGNRGRGSFDNRRPSRVQGGWQNNQSRY